MTTKLTLSVDKRVVQRAKLFARAQKQSLSQIVTTYLDHISRQVAGDEDIDPEVVELSDPIALRLLTNLRRTGTSCFTSAVVLANMNYILAKAKGKEYSINKLRSLRRMVEVASIDEAMVDAAIAVPHRDFEDSL